MTRHLSMMSSRLKYSFSFKWCLLHAFQSWCGFQGSVTRKLPNLLTAKVIKENMFSRLQITKCVFVFHIRNQDFRGDHLRGLIRRCRLEVTALFFFVSFLNYLLPFLLQELLLIFLKGLIFCFLSSRTTKSLNFFVFLSLLHLALHFGFICVSLGNFFFVFWFFATQKLQFFGVFCLYFVFWVLATQNLKFFCAPQPSPPFCVFVLFLVRMQKQYLYIFKCMAAYNDPLLYILDTLFFILKRNEDSDYYFISAFFLLPFS